MQNKQRLGAILWLLSLQYYVVQIVCAGAWSSSPGFSWIHNTISDLGNTVCGPYGARQVCSPLHGLMNVSFVLLGLTMIGGTLLLWHSLARNTLAAVGMASLLAAGVGTILVGFFPENTVAPLHIVGAALPFVLGNLAMLLIGLSSTSLGRSLKLITVAAGAFGLLSLVAFQLIGGGGLERLVAYPQSLWMIIVGATLLFSKASNQVDSSRHNNRAKNV